MIGLRGREMIRPIYTYRNSQGSKFGAIMGICAAFLLASLFLNYHPDLTFWPVTIFCASAAATGFVLGAIVGALIDPPRDVPD